MIELTKVLKLAEAEGATEAEVFLRRKLETTVRFSGKVETIKSQDITGISLRVAVGRRVAVVGIEDLSEDGVVRGVKSAVAIAKTLPEDPKWVSLPKRLGRTSVEGVFCRSTSEVSAEELVEVVRDIMEGITEGSKLAKPVRGTLGVGMTEVMVVNSYSEVLKRRETFAGFYVVARAEEAGRSTTFSDYLDSRSIKEVREVGREVGRSVGRKAEEFLKAEKVREGKFNVIIHPNVMNELLTTLLGPAVSAEEVQKGRSPLKGRLGEEVFSREFTVIDEGTEGRFPGSREFDDEGVPTRRLPVIEGGVLKTYLYDTYTANIEGRESTGNARRGLSSAPRPSPNVLYLKPGGLSEGELVREVKEGYYVLSTIGAWLSNPVSGLMQATITHAYVIKGGEIKGVATGGVLSGNFYEVMKDNLIAIGRKVKVGLNVVTPPVALHSVRLAGEK